MEKSQKQRRTKGPLSLNFGKAVPDKRRYEIKVKDFVHENLLCAHEILRVAQTNWLLGSTAREL